MVNAYTHGCDCDLSVELHIWKKRRYILLSSDDIPRYQDYYSSQVLI